MIKKAKTSSQLLFEQLAINLDKVSFEQLPNYTAVEYFLTVEDEPDSNVTNFEKVIRYLEAFHHLCEVEDWNRANQVITYGLDISNQQQLHSQLGIWGYYKEQINLYSRLVNKLNEPSNFVVLKGLGNAYQSLSEYDKAINYFDQGLLIAEKIQDEIKQADILRDLGTAYGNLRKYNKALIYLSKSLTIVQKNICLGSILFDNFKEINNFKEKQKLESSIFANFGNIYGERKNLNKAREYLEQSLRIAQKVGDRETENHVINNLGKIYTYQNEYSLAISCFQQYLLFALESEYRFHQAKAMINLGNVYTLKEEYDTAIKLFEKSLEISRDIGDREGEATALLNLGNLSEKQGNNEAAIKSLKKGLFLNIKIENA